MHIFSQLIVQNRDDLFNVITESNQNILVKSFKQYNKLIYKGENKSILYSINQK